MDEIQKVFYSWNIRVTIYDGFATIENFVVPYCFRLKLLDPVAKFIDCACNNCCTYLLTSNEVIRFKNLTEELLIDSTGAVYVSGCGTRGEMGCGKLILQTCLRKVPMFTTFKIRLVSVGGWHVLALDDGDNVFGWGWNGNGQLGFPKDERSVVSYPEHICIPTAASLKSVACGSRHSLILAEGELFGCGWNEYGQIDPRLVGIAAGAFSSLLFLKEKTNGSSLIVL
ncbi:putative E3 ubiquitin-protein ligase [Trichinella pseudospiralis]